MVVGISKRLLAVVGCLGIFLCGIFLGGSESLSVAMGLLRVIVRFC